LDLELKGMRAAVTGASRGIGRSIAEHFADEGCDVAICARGTEDLDEAAAALRKRGARCVARSLDIRDPDAFAAWIAEAVGELGGVDLYVSNVSAQSFDWGESYEVDVRSCVTGVERVLPALRRSGAGAIVGIASQAAHMAVPSYKPYSAMKAALVSFLSSLSRELAPEGIRVNCVSPAEVYFPGGFWSRMATEDPDLFAQALEKNIMGRFCSPEEVARAVVFLASPAASFVSGINLLVDGAGHSHVQF